MATYRSVLEVAKWIEPKDSLLSTAVVSRVWHKAASSEELWQVYVENLKLETNSDFASFKDVYHFCRRLPALISPTTLHLFLPNSRMWRNVPLTSPIIVDKSSSWAQVSEGNFICTGGGAGQDTHSDADADFNVAFKVLRSGVVGVLASMNVKRKWHGSIAVKGRCYVFGGVSGGQDISSTERLSLEDVDSGSWVRLSDMLSPRSSFNPCERQGSIYLLGGKTSQCEVFYQTSETFEQLPFSLQCGHTSTVEVEGRLVVLLSTAMLREVRDGEFRQQSHHWQYVCGNMNPVLSGNECYIPQAYNHFSIFELNMTTEELVKISVPQLQE